MYIKYDKENDGIFFILGNNAIVESQEIAKDIIVDYDKDDNIVSVEILKFSTKEERIELPFEIQKVS